MKIKEKNLRILIEQSLRVQALIKEDANDVQTISDLRTLINKAIKKKKLKGSAKAGLEGVLDVIPGLGAAKSVAGALKALYSLPDSSRPKGALGSLDVDDDISAIVDDSIENKFLNAMAKRLESMPEGPLTDFNMTNFLADYISSKFNKRTVSGF
jgi:hypothetical protein